MTDKDRGWHFLIDASCRRSYASFSALRDTRLLTFKSWAWNRPQTSRWKRGHLEHAVIVTKDKDFASLAITRSDLCPVIFVRIGNLRRGPLLAKFESVMQNLIQALNNGDKIIEIA